MTDILDAMRRIPGYIDITTSDFREVYRLGPQPHALERLFAKHPRRQTSCASARVRWRARHCGWTRRPGGRWWRQGDEEPTGGRRWGVA